MKSLVPISALLLLAVFCSCKKATSEQVEWNGGPAVEISFVDKGVQGKATQASEAYEKVLKSIVVLAYESGSASSAEPVIKYPFAAPEVAAGKAVVALDETTQGKQLDFYVVANFDNQSLKDDAKAPTLSNLKAMLESDAEAYNANTLPGLTDGSKNFAMSAYKSVQTNASGSNKPTSIEMVLDRTVARVDVKTTVDAAFAQNYPAGKLEIKSASITRYAKKGMLIKEATEEDMAASIGNMETNGPLLQDNSSTTKDKNGDFRFYLFSCGDRHSTGLEFDGETTKYDPSTHKHVLLTVMCDFTLYGKTESIRYRIPITGNATKGAMSRNSIYSIDVKLQGITEQQIKASVTVAPWANVVSQDVIIGG